MPGFDGTGPRGLGPMTGGAEVSAPFPQAAELLVGVEEAHSMAMGWLTAHLIGHLHQLR